VKWDTHALVGAGLLDLEGRSHFSSRLMAMHVVAEAHAEVCMERRNRAVALVVIVNLKAVDKSLRHKNDRESCVPAQFRHPHHHSFHCVACPTSSSRQQNVGRFRFRNEYGSERMRSSQSFAERGFSSTRLPVRWHSIGGCAFERIESRGWSELTPAAENGRRVDRRSDCHHLHKPAQVSHDLD
jgi:hypothetical protein